MAIWIDKKYLNLLSPQLELFKWKKDTVANHRCPLCGDSQKNKFKARGYWFARKGGMFYKCHNCNASMGFSRFLKERDSQLYKEYAMERYKNGDNKYSNYKKPDLTAPQPFFETNQDDRLIDRLMDRVDKLPDTHMAVKYVASRQIPKDQWKRLYFIDDIQKMESLSENTRDKFPSHEPRLVIPCFDGDDTLLGCICRAFDVSEGQRRYLTAKVDPDYPLIFGLDQATKTEPIIVVEGPIDSLFLPNCIGAGGTNLTSLKNYLPMDKTILVYDYQPRNKEVVKIIGKAIDQGFTVSLLPEDFPGKDINEAIENGLTSEQIHSIIMNNKCSGAKAKLIFSKWKKI